MNVNKIEIPGLVLDVPQNAPLSSWQRPNQGFLKCNVGSSWINVQHNSGAACLLRDHTGFTLLHSRRSYSGVPSTLEADLLSLYWAVERLGTLNHRSVVFECSSTLVMNAINHPHNFPLLRHLIADICAILATFVFWDMTTTLPENNSIALAIALSVTREKCYQSYIA